MAVPGSHLRKEGLNIAALRELASKELVDVLDSVRGKKALVLDPNLTGPLSLIAEFPLLRDHGVEKIYILQPGKLETELKSLIYLCRPQMKYMKYISDHIKNHQKDSASEKYDYAVFFTPRRTMICERVLEEDGVFGDITVGEYHMDWVALENDLISLELETGGIGKGKVVGGTNSKLAGEKDTVKPGGGVFKELYLDGDLTSLYYAARALMKLQKIYGLFPRIIGKGDYAKQLSDMLLRMRREQAVDITTTNNSSTPTLLNPLNTLSNHIDQLIIIDRSVDLVTPLCMQLTYEGLIDEVFGIRNSFIEVDTSFTAVSDSSQTKTSSNSSSTPTSATGKTKKVSLNSADKLFDQIRDLNFAVVGGILNKIAKRINENYEARHEAKTVAQIREFVGRLNELQGEHMSLRTHTGIAEEIVKYTVSDEFNGMLEVQQNILAGSDSQKDVDYIEEMIDRQEDFVKVLRLLCLLSVTQGGLKPKVYEFFKREILQTYGYEHLITFAHLSALSLLIPKPTTASSRTPFSQIRKSIQLFVEDVDEANPKDIAYVYSGYAPLSVRLVQCVVGGQRGSGGFLGGPKAAGGGWKGSEEIVRGIPGRTFDEVQKVEGEGASLGRNKSSRTHPRTTLIFFLGGCTYTEISAIRFLAQQDEAQREYLIATTQILNGNTLLESVIAKAAVGSMIGRGG